jgi:hypothetical protein
MIRYFGYAGYLESVRGAAGTVAGIAGRHAARVSGLRAADCAGAGIRAGARRSWVPRFRLRGC